MTRDDNGVTKLKTLKYNTIPTTRIFILISTILQRFYYVSSGSMGRGQRGLPMNIECIDIMLSFCSWNCNMSHEYRDTVK